MTSAIGVSSSGRSGSVRACARRQAPAMNRLTPTTAKTAPRIGNGRNWSVSRSMSCARPPGGRPTEICRRTCATPRASTSRPANMSRSQRFTPMPGWSQRRSLTWSASPASLALELAVEDLDGLVPLLAQPTRELLRKDDRAMAAAGAADCDRQATLALVAEGRNAELEQPVDQLEVLGCARLGEHEVAHGLCEPGQLTQLRDVVRVLDEARIEDEVGLERDAEFVAEADQLERHRVRLEVGDSGEEPLAKLAQREVGRVDDDVCLGPDRIEQPPLERDRRLRAPAVGQRVPVTRLGEAADQ